MAGLQPQAVKMQRLGVLFSGRNLQMRLASALILAPLALYVAWVGGHFATLVVAAIAVLMFWEWNRLIAGEENNLPFWIGCGLLYALAFLVSLILLRRGVLGLEAVLLLLATVWATDIFSYLAGTILQGPKLWPRISPRKTWAGFIGGLIAGAAAAYLMAIFLALPPQPVYVLLGLTLSLAAQLGDLLESWIKRRFNVKDAGALIPGHGGMLDRLDSLVAASLVAYLIGAARAAPLNPAEGLLLW